MIASMTGFGRAKQDGPKGTVIVEIQSINRKFLEVFVSLPKELLRFENEVRKSIGESVLRGQVSVRIHYLPSLSMLQYCLPNRELLSAMKIGWEQIADFLGYDPKTIDLSFLLQHSVSESKQSLLESFRQEDFIHIGACLSEALQRLNEMKIKEGQALIHDIAERLRLLAHLLDKIEQLAPESTMKMRKKLKERMEEIFRPNSELDERLLREVAIFAERVDITEEITRLKSHFAQYQAILAKKLQGSGRKMDFLVQEIGREINTIGSKALDAEIAHLVVEMKSELEKIREQIQNIE